MSEAFEQEERNEGSTEEFDLSIQTPPEDPTLFANHERVKTSPHRANSLSSMVTWTLLASFRVGMVCPSLQYVSGDPSDWLSSTR